jgi:hypothetical protein
MRRKARFTMKEVTTLIKAAQKEHARVVIEMDEGGKFRMVFNEVAQPVDRTEEIVL